MNATLQMCRVASLLVVGVLDSVEGLTDIVEDVIYVFNTYGETDEVRGHAGFT